jgi:hypothetical protein
MDRTILAAAAALLGTVGCVEDGLDEPFYLTPVEVTDARFAGDIGEADDLDVQDDYALGERNGDLLTVTTAGEYDDGQAMTIVTLMTWDRPVLDALVPGTRMHWGHSTPEEEELPASEQDPGAPEPASDLLAGADVVGCAGPDPETWYDEIADEVEVTVNEGDTPNQRVLEYAAVFRNDEPGLPEETRVTGSFAFVP